MDMYDYHHDNPPFSPHKNSNDFNNKIILTVIISLSVVVVIVLMLHIYARCVLRRRESRRAALFRQLGFATDQAQSTEPPKAGLDPSVIAALPEFIFKQDDTQGDTGTIECAVCLSALAEGEMARLLPNCKHTFHVQCIDKWLSSQPTCPICRNEVEPLLVVKAGEPPVAGDPPTAPPLELVTSALTSMEGTSNGAVQLPAKASESNSNSRLSSFRRMLSRERSSRRAQTCGQDDGVEDLERQ